jgi:hypothetical protein
MCPRWRQSFEAFLSDVGRKPIGTRFERVDKSSSRATFNGWCGHAAPAR